MTALLLSIYMAFTLSTALNMSIDDQNSCLLNQYALAGLFLGATGYVLLICLKVTRAAKRPRD